MRHALVLDRVPHVLALLLACVAVECRSSEAAILDDSERAEAAILDDSERAEPARRAAPAAPAPPKPRVERRTSACPLEMAHIDGYCVDRWEAELVTVDAEGRETPWPHYQRPEEGIRYEARSVTGVFPQGYISRIEAQAACENAGKRLCSRVEWSRACKGRKGHRYPYGNEHRKGACNSGKPYLLTRIFGPDNRAYSYASFNDRRLDRIPGFLEETGSREACQGEDGTFDMVGNLHEWVSDNVRSDVERVLEQDWAMRKKQPWAPGNGMFMGGFFSTTGELGPGCSYITIAHEPAYHDYSTGFRCCMDAKGAEESLPAGP